VFLGSTKDDKEGLLKRLARRRRDGAGLYISDWRPDEHEGAFAEAVVTWCRETIATTRRPFGIDHFDLALAWRDVSGAAVRSHRFLQLRPVELYTEAFLDQLAALLRPAEPAHVSVAVFSWGDAAHAELSP
jgi:hypothetical protein